MARIPNGSAEAIAPLMGKLKLPSQERLKCLFAYSEDTGSLTWKVTRAGNAVAGKAVSSLDGSGYIRVMVDGSRYKAHRLIWKIITGHDPADEIDHKNGIRTDNRKCNLREASTGEQPQNRFIRSDNKTGVVGVCWDKKKGKWVAQVRANKKRVFSGCFSDFNEAHAAYLKHRAIHQEFQPIPRELA